MARIGEKYREAAERLLDRAASLYDDDAYDRKVPVLLQMAQVNATLALSEPTLLLGEPPTTTASPAPTAPARRGNRVK